MNPWPKITHANNNQPTQSNNRTHHTLAIVREQIRYNEKEEEETEGGETVDFSGEENIKIFICIWTITVYICLIIVARKILCTILQKLVWVFFGVRWGKCGAYAFSDRLM